MKEVFTLDEALDVLRRYRDCMTDSDCRPFYDVMYNGLFEVKDAIKTVLIHHGLGNPITTCRGCRHCTKKNDGSLFCSLHVIGPCDQFQPTENNN